LVVVVAQLYTIVVLIQLATAGVVVEHQEEEPFQVAAAELAATVVALGVLELPVKATTAELEYMRGIRAAAAEQEQPALIVQQTVAQDYHLIY
jgi:hypothetical protein